LFPPATLDRINIRLRNIMQKSGRFVQPQSSRDAMPAAPFNNQGMPMMQSGAPGLVIAPNMLQVRPCVANILFLDFFESFVSPFVFEFSLTPRSNASAARIRSPRSGTIQRHVFSIVFSHIRSRLVKNT
jgi:hypothetical protein